MSNWKMVFKPDLINLFAEMFTCGPNKINCVHVWGEGLCENLYYPTVHFLKILISSLLLSYNGLIWNLTDIKQDGHKWLSQNDKCGHFVMIMKTLHSFKCDICNVSVINLILREKKTISFIEGRSISWELHF